MSNRTLTLLGQAMVEQDRLRTIISNQKKEIAEVRKSSELAWDETNDLRAKMDHLETIEDDLRYYRTQYETTLKRAQEAERELTLLKRGGKTNEQIAKKVVESNLGRVVYSPGVTSSMCPNAAYTDAMGKKIEHVKRTRELTGLGLVEAKQLVEAVYRAKFLEQSPLHTVDLINLAKDIVRPDPTNLYKIRYIKDLRDKVASMHGYTPGLRECKDAVESALESFGVPRY